MSSSTPDTDNKRRRTTSEYSSDPISIINLPHDHLIAIADYLPRTSRGLLAVALTEKSKAFVDCKEGLQPNDASKAIISMPKNTEWDKVSFAYLGELASRLNDNDVHALLSVIDAKNKMKILSLGDGSCSKLKGHGLKPLAMCVTLPSNISSQLLLGTERPPTRVRNK